LALLVFSGLAAPSRSDAGGLTGFIQNASPHGRPGIGFALSLPLFTEIVSLEGEYSRSREEDRSPSLTMWSGSLLLTLPAEILRLKPYFVIGVGFYRQSFESISETSLSTQQGFGTFLRLAGPAHLRLDYRAIQLKGDPLQENQKRFYGGITLRF
jgi:hypothetical protein